MNVGSCEDMKTCGESSSKQAGKGKSIWCYTGYTLEDDLLAEDGRARCSGTMELLKCFDVLVDGEFDIMQKDITLRFRGSRTRGL